MFRLLLFLLPFLAWGSATQVEIRDSEGECLPADNSINTGPSEIILNKSPRLCHREMDASAQSRWLLESGEGTRTESRVPAAAIGARTGGERALAEATGCHGRSVWSWTPPICASWRARVASTRLVPNCCRYSIGTRVRCRKTAFRRC